MIAYTYFLTFLLLSFVTYNKFERKIIKNLISILIIFISAFFVGYRDFIGGDTYAYSKFFNSIEEIPLLEFHSKDIMWSVIQLLSIKLFNLDYIHFQFLVSLLIIILCHLSSRKLNNYILIFVLSIIIYSLFFNISFQRQALAACIIFYLSTFKSQNKWTFILLVISILIHKSSIFFIFYLMLSDLSYKKLNIDKIKYLIFFLVFLMFCLLNLEIIFKIFSKDFFQNIFDIFVYLSAEKTRFTLSKSILIIMPIIATIFILKKENKNYENLYFYYFLAITLFILSLLNSALIERLLLIFYFYQFLVISKFSQYYSLYKNKIYLEFILICVYINYILFFFYATTQSDEYIYSNYYL